ncbi:uncharacterized protein LOC125837574 [Solanum verrucosum]|uniref:uncharacterized protein LOC125837574 n=1 Tax=Solanum verrucosum TaxID=315347 RepID=UPI0020D19C55|nr:uncharacterized protein LOC125837574 [Solanum verrucosum]
MLSQVVSNQAGQQRVGFQDVADTSRIHELLRMNTLEFTGSNVIEGLENFLEELSKMFEVMHVADVERMDLAAYQLRGVSIRRARQERQTRPTPSSASAPALRNICDFRNQNPQNSRARPTQSQGSVAQREFPKNRQGNANRGNKAQYSSAAPVDKALPKKATLGTCKGTNRLYAITSSQE